MCLHVPGKHAFKTGLVRIIVRIIGRVYRVMSEAYPSTARSRINLVTYNSIYEYPIRM